VSAPDPVARLQGLLDKIEAARGELERVEDPDRAVEILQRLSELAQDVQAEVERARGDADASP
jgi:hypothetical protein